MCVLGLGLVGGSIMRAATAAGREVFGYNRSIEGAQAATADGFDADTDLTATLSRAADSDALIVLAVPMPALPSMLAHVKETAPRCPLTDVTSVKKAVLDEVVAAGLRDRFVGGHPMAGTAHSGWTAGHAGLFTGAPWVVSVDDHVDPVVWAMVMTLALDCGAVVVPARSDEHDAAAAAISHLPHLLAEALAVVAGDVPLAFALAAGSFRDGTRVAATAPTWCGRCARATPTNWSRRPTTSSSCSGAPAIRWPTTIRSPTSSRPAMPLAPATTASRAPTSSTW